MPKKLPIPRNPDSGKNLVKDIDKKTLETIGRTVVEEYDEDVRSRSEWEKNRSNYLKLFTGFRDPKNSPWEGASNVHVPLMGIASLQFHARVYDSIIPSSGEIAKTYATDGKAVEQAERVAKHMNWQLRYEMEEWEEDMDKLLLQLPINGVGYKKTYYDPTLRRNVSKHLGADELVTPYGCKRLEDCPRKTHIMEMYPNEIKIRQMKGIFLNTEKILSDGQIIPGPIMQPMAKQQLAEMKEKIDGITQNTLGNDRPRLILEQHRNWDLDGDGYAEPYIITVDHETQSVLRIVSREYNDPLTNRRITFEYFTPYDFIPNPESHYGIGFGQLLGGLNEAANTIINQLIDAGHLSNTRAGLIDERSGLKKSDLSFKLGEFKSVRIATDDIRKAIYQFQFNPPSQALFALLGLLQEYSERISSVSSAMTGQPPSSDTAASAYLAALEQGLKVFSVIHKRIHRSLSKELKKIFLLNRVYLNEKVYFTVQDSTSLDMIGYESGRSDYSNNIDVIPTSDPNIVSRELKLIKAQQAYQIARQDPIIASNPQSMYKFTQMVFKAMEIPNLQDMMPPPVPEQPPDLPPEEENAGFLREVGSTVLPEQNHAEHLRVHQDFAESRWGQQLTPQGRNLLEAHIRDTISAAYLAEQEAVAQLGGIMAAETLAGGGLPPAEFSIGG
jgi:chaperonin GroES